MRSHFSHLLKWNKDKHMCGLRDVCEEKLARNTLAFKLSSNFESSRPQGFNAFVNLNNDSVISISNCVALITIIAFQQQKEIVCIEMVSLLNSNIRSFNCCFDLYDFITNDYRGFNSIVA